MIFVYSFIAFVIGVLFMELIGTGYLHHHNAADYIGALVMTGGLIGMTVSLLMLVSRFVP